MRSARVAWWWVVVALVAGLVIARWPRSGQRAPLPSSKILLFAPNLNEAAYVLGQGARIAAVTDYCVWPPELLGRPRLGGILNPNLERIVGFDPGLLVLQGENESLRVFARREGIAVADVQMDGDLESVFTGILALDDVLAGTSSRRGEVVVDSLRERLDALRGPVSPTSSPRVLLVLGHAPGSLRELLVVGPGTYLQDLVALVGGRPVPPDGGAYRNLSLESLVADPPDVAIDLRPGATADPKEEAKFEATWRALGIENTRGAIIDFDGILIPGPRVDQSASAIREAIFRARRDR